MTLAEWEELYKKDKLSAEPAHASRMPFHSGDGYSYGGGALVTIGPTSMLVGEGDGSFELAQEIARRWNHVANVCKHEFADGILLPAGGMQAICTKCGFVGRTL